MEENEDKCEDCVHLEDCKDEFIFGDPPLKPTDCYELFES